MNATSNSSVAANFTTNISSNSTIPTFPPRFKRPKFDGKYNFTGRDQGPNGDERADRNNKTKVRFGNDTVDIDNSNFKRNTPLAYNSTRKGQLDEMIGA